MDTGIETSATAGGTHRTPLLSRKRRQTQERLLAAALDAFAERGLYGTSVEDICDRAGFSRGAFYSNFASKDELLAALYRQQAGRLLDALAAAAQGPAPDLAALVARIIDAVPADRRWFLVGTESVLHAVRHPEAAAALVAHRADLRAGLAALLTDTLRALGREPALPVDDLARAIVALHEGSLAQSYLEPDRRTPTDLVAGIVPGLLDALAPVQSGVDSRTHRQNGCPAGS